MMQMIRKLWMVALLLCVYTLQARQLVVYPAPPNAPEGLENKDFTVKVRKPGGAWQELYAYNVKVDEMRGTAHHVQNASLCSFDFSGDVEVSVTYNKGRIETARIRPLSFNIAYTARGNTLYFKLDRPRNLSVEINGDLFHNLHLFANPVDDFKVDKKDPDLVYFGPGVHQLPGGRLNVPSGKTVYVAGGAVLMGQLLVSQARDVTIRGRGIIDFSVKEGVKIAYSKNVLVEGLCFTQCPTGGSDSVTIRNVKSISSYGWGDGLNVFASNNVLFDGVFCRNSDDCTTVYATRKDYTGGCRNITMQNSTLWADVAHPILIGTHGNSTVPDVIEDVKYMNIDILDHNELQLDYQGCMSINTGDNNLVRNVLFQDIRVENFRRGQLVNLRVFYNKKYCTAPGRNIEEITFRNITYNGSGAELSVIAGYDSTRQIRNVTFENLVINGVKITDHMKGKPGWYKTSDMARFFVGEHVENIQFK
ncbi:glycosyl hydrolase family 28 protein [Niabella drilacis]|uniref:Glycosyl hydrolases family 28 n=1 Tax=Niabella drilacis (strain DSM 25811 / CCM 8410 / CCUG 62505 / LMG 26954 / E90) TaxID=1285928 RepID=A0A1G6S7J0_NIADE|nr:glycosyl hydrolase family 28 protein [Niabella drilacis]SDD12087.1 Glycosyl hydrolases family 28 [Niabella drilacis]